MMSEVRRMRELHEAGLTRNQISKEIERNHPLILRHLPHAVRTRVGQRQQCRGLKTDALRIERLYAACNRALAEARV